MKSSDSISAKRLQKSPTLSLISKCENPLFLRSMRSLYHSRLGGLQKTLTFFVFALRVLRQSLGSCLLRVNVTQLDTANRVTTITVVPLTSLKSRAHVRPNTDATLYTKKNNNNVCIFFFVEHKDSQSHRTIELF
ncbi:hypothetical protein IscW_ISCW022718 [Ixodes scapularis]|uniref:Uncharacterized protein n=1 Tax=Ixodes scapularis TaxID=6945 RepID=B7QDX9_IXOSC|nr:hypothetical protein IscW_ISCW022718 [Ixodes scapularis]|eukprot:XP_002413743.1 hypothetical protein IscW_ISCW022718 [Ixodes scapularis]